jgi:2-polyprenyl-3-methyl-5-hydroxy-6-metoxy-1,4-benzoquinol methylase
MIPLLNFNLIAKNVELIDSIWYSKGRSKISYPEEANSSCFQLEDRSFWFRHRNSVIVEVIKKFPPQDGYLLDIGGGNGFVSSAIESNGFSAILVEPGKCGIQNAKKRGINNLVCSSLEDLQINESSIPAIGLFDVLEHIEKDKDFLAQIYKMLNPEGRIYLTIPAYNFLWSGEDVYAGHYRRYNLDTIAETLKKAGFNIDYKSYFFSILPVPVFFFRSLPFKMGLRKGSKNLKSQANEHSKREGIIGRLLDRIWSWEIKKISKSEIIPFGGSCLIVATKSATK